MKLPISSLTSQLAFKLQKGLPKVIRLANQDSNDPRFNLALEEYLLRNFNEGNFLLLYRNSPSVILGKHQNFFEEVNLKKVREEGIPVVRRISGGGTVYHDLGNLNFSIITEHHPSLHNNYEPFLRPIIKALERFSISSYINNRNSLVLYDGRKISGNAQFASRGRMMSHGTLLLNSDLDRLQQILTPDTEVEDSRAVQSVRSKVANIIELLPAEVTLDEVVMEVERELMQGSREVIELDENQLQDVQRLSSERYDSWEWNVGRSPQYHIRRQLDEKHRLIIEVRKGIITSIYSPDLPLTLFHSENIQSTLIGKACRPEELDHVIEQVREAIQTTL